MVGEYKEKYWVVFVGHNPGIYTNWEEAELQVNGYSGNLLKMYKTLEEAEDALLAFHEERHRLNQIRMKHELSDGDLTSTSALEIQHGRRTVLQFVVTFILGFICCILLAHLLG